MSALFATLADGWRIAFLTAAAPLVGSVLLLTIARLTGARWNGIEGAVPLLPALAVGGVLLGLAQFGHAPPDHLRLWMSWWAVGLRGGIAGALIAYAGFRLRGGAGVNLAAATVAGYTVLVTPVAADWMLGQVPGHPVSAIGMMLTVEAIGAAAALLLVAGRGPVPTRGDMARLMIAAALGLAYLSFMDYLIVWYGNLPSRVGFYLERGTPAMVALVWAALLIGLAAPVGLLSLVEGERGRRAAGVAVLIGLLLFNGWWVGGGLAALLLGAVLTGLLGAGGWAFVRREAARG